MGEFVGQGFDFAVLGPDSFGIARHLIQQRLNHRRHLGFGGGIEVQMIKFGEWIHGGYYTAIIL